MTPAMMATWVFGLAMVLSNWQIYKTQGWLHAKLTLVVILTIYHLACGKYRLKLATNPKLKTHSFWRWFNEIPVFILLGVVFLAVLKPF